MNKFIINIFFFIKEKIKSIILFIGIGTFVTLTINFSSKYIVPNFTKNNFNLELSTFLPLYNQINGSSKSNFLIIDAIFKKNIFQSTLNNYMPEKLSITDGTFTYYYDLCNRDITDFNIGNLSIQKGLVRFPAIQGSFKNFIENDSTLLVEPINYSYIDFNTKNVISATKIIPFTNKNISTPFDITCNQSIERILIYKNTQIIKNITNDFKKKATTYTITFYSNSGKYKNVKKIGVLSYLNSENSKYLSLNTLLSFALHYINCNDFINADYCIKTISHLYPESEKNNILRLCIKNDNSLPNIILDEFKNSIQFIENYDSKDWISYFTYHFISNHSEKETLHKYYDTFIDMLSLLEKEKKVDLSFEKYFLAFTANYYDSSIKFLKQYLKNIQSGQREISLYSNLASLYVLLGNYSEAEYYYDRALEVDIEDDYFTNLIILNKAICYLSQNNIKKADSTILSMNQRYTDLFESYSRLKQVNEITKIALPIIMPENILSDI